ncbi:Clavaminate synthase-like protein [Gloeopeniophorella convolvens]|nr:Clavaminate synthase-like protein [Gloeopeniophorella convolvens]
MSLVEAAKRANTSFSEIPIINLKSVADPDPKVQQALARQIRDACVDVGFFYVSEHGIPEETIASALTSMETFFALPHETKMELDNTKTPNFKGYNAVLASNNDPTGAGDMHEGFEFGWEALHDAPGALDPRRAEDGSMAGANVWPDVPGFREALLEYYHAAVGLGKHLFPLFARALDLAPDFFDDKTRNSAALMRVLHYPPQTGPVDERVIGIGAHTDFEVCLGHCFTILWQQPGIQALQVRNARGDWIDAPPIPRTLVINLGDQFARWTNDVFKSTVHRAANRSGAERYSMPLFFGTDYDVRLEPIPSCVSEERPPHYEAVTAGDYVKMRLQAAYGH